MKTLTTVELKELRGGFTLTSSLMNSLNNLMKILLDAGEKVGSAFRRIGSNTICPLE